MNSVMPKPRAPWWLHVQPQEGEDFVDFWLRAGITMTKISWALDVKLKGAEDVANDRLAHVCSERFRHLYLRKRNAWLTSHGF